MKQDRTDDLELHRRGDEGKPFVNRPPEAEAARALREIIRKIVGEDKPV